MSHDQFTKKVQSAYSTAAQSYASNWDTPWHWLDEDRAKFLSHIVSGATIADVGCNSGSDAHYFTTHGYRVTGFDQSAEALAIAKTKFPGVEFVQADILSLKDLNRQFNGIWAAHSLLHIPIRSFDLAIHVLKALALPTSTIMLIMATADQTIEELADIKIYNAQDGKVLVPLVRWNIDELKSHLVPHFSILWERHYNMGVSGKPAVSLLMKLTDTQF